MVLNHFRVFTYVGLIFVFIFSFGFDNLKRYSQGGTTVIKFEEELSNNVQPGKKFLKHINWKKMFLAISITFSENLMFGHGDCSNRTKIKEFRKCVDEIYLQDTFEVSMKSYNHTKLLSSVGMSDIIFPSENSITISSYV